MPNMEQGSTEELHSLEKKESLNDNSQGNFSKMDFKKWANISFNVVIFITVGFPVLGRYLYNATPTHRGFFCNDDTLQYPYKGDTITNTLLYKVGYSVPTVLIFLNEFYECFKRTKNQSSTNSFSLKIFINDLIWMLYIRVGTFLFGAFINEIFTNVPKLIIGRLRPNFLDVCKPNIDCSVQKFPYMYITNFTCMGNDLHRIEDSRKSFPSGHSSFSFYVILFLIMYFQYCATWKGPKLLKPCLQMIFLLIAWCIVVSRVYDNRHHWSDVVVGIILGCVVAIGTVYVISGFSPKSKQKKESIENITNIQNDISLYAVKTNVD